MRWHMGYLSETNIKEGYKRVHVVGFGSQNEVGKSIFDFGVAFNYRVMNIFL